MSAVMGCGHGAAIRAEPTAITNHRSGPRTVDAGAGAHHISRRDRYRSKAMGLTWRMVERGETSGCGGWAKTGDLALAGVTVKIRPCAITTHDRSRKLPLERI